MEGCLYKNYASDSYCLIDSVASYFVVMIDLETFEQQFIQKDAIEKEFELIVYQSKASSINNKCEKFIISVARFLEGKYKFKFYMITIPKIRPVQQQRRASNIFCSQIFQFNTTLKNSIISQIFGSTGTKVGNKYNHLETKYC